METNSTCKYSVVIPTYNEKDNIRILIDRLIKVFMSVSEENPTFEIIVTDDNSPDLTWKVVQDYSEKDDRVKCIRRFANRGLSPSIIEGFNNAKGEFFIVMDADLQHDENSIPGMLRKAEDSDLVLGTRYADGGRIEGSWSPFRKLCSIMATLAAKIVLGVKVSDPMSGFFLVRKSAYMRIRNYLNPKGFKILLEILYLLKKIDSSARIKEYGIFFRRRTAGESKLSAKVILQYFVSLWELRNVKIKSNP